MKKSFIIWASAILVLAMLTTSCQDIFETDSRSLVFEEDNQLHSTSDSVYSVLGILSQIGKIGERYVLTGELRGDLMSATDDAPSDMQELANFNLSASNRYRDISDYYAIINNCNYAIARMDTSLLSYQTKVMLPEWVQLKTLRAWTYWQIGLLAGRVRWFTTPLLSVSEASAEYPEISLDELATRLIADLKPYTEERELNYGTIDGFYSSQMFIPVNMLLGDLYLFLNHYEEAALAYYDVIDRHGLLLSGDYMSRWARITRESAYMNHNNSYTSELLTTLVFSSNPVQYHPLLVRYSYNDVPAIVPSTKYISQMEHSIHYYGEPSSTSVMGYFAGDLRGLARDSKGQYASGDYAHLTLNSREGDYIYKFVRAATSTASGRDPYNDAFTDRLAYTRILPLYRTPHVYLRLAEALNRSGRPTMAFAVVKYGLNSTTLNDTTRVDSAEVTYPFSEFTLARFAGNVGTATRGRGLGASYDQESFIIPERETLVDTIEFVEDLILDEMAAETAFEGNRFFDLLRIARHRDDFPGFMADKVAARFPNTPELKEKLKQPAAWFVK